MEPLSLIRPKALLPFGDTTVLGRLAGQVSLLSPGRVAVNASRCPELLADELRRAHSGCEPSVFFEERPLGASATLARLADVMSGGTWMVVNTDMVIPEFDAAGMLEAHRTSGVDWTALVGEMPGTGSYSPLLLDDRGGFGVEGSKPCHYWGVSLMEPVVSRLSGEIQASRGLFSELAAEVLRRGGMTGSFRGSGGWLDMGDIGMLRANILSGGTFEHPGACVAAGASLEGRNSIGRGCILARGTTSRESVMLEGSSLESGELDGRVLPWLCCGDDGSGT